MVHKNKTQKYLVNTWQNVWNVSCLLLGVKFRQEKDAPTTHPRTIKAPDRKSKTKEQKLTKTMLSASHLWVFDTEFTISVLKSKYGFHHNSNRTRTARVGVLNWVSKFYAPPPLILNTNVIKRESKTGYPQDSISYYARINHYARTNHNSMFFYISIQKVLE